MGFKTPKDTAKAIETAGVNKSKLSWDIILLQGFFAGAYIAFGGLLAVIVGGGYKGDSPGIKKFLYGAVFPVGLVAVILTGAELFTGNTMCLIPPLLSGKISWKGWLKNWGVSYLGNFIGSIFVVVFLTWLPNMLSNPTWVAAIQGIAVGKNKLGFGVVLLRAIGCNWLVCLAVWQAIASEDMMGKILSIWWPIMAFVAIGYEHCVANMFFVPAGLLYGAKTDFGTFVGLNLIPATIGNIIGGSFFMGVTYWYIFSDKEPWASRKKAGSVVQMTETSVEKKEEEKETPVV